MNYYSIKLQFTSVLLFIFLFASCADRENNNSSIDIDSTAMKQSWLKANEENVLQILKSKGYDQQKTGESQVKIAEYSIYGDGASVIFADKNDSLPKLVCAAYLLPTDKEKTTWKIHGSIIATGAGGNLKTISFGKSTGIDSPNLSVELDNYLSRQNMKREKSPVEGLF